MSVGASEFWENDADEKLLKLIFVVLLLQQNVGHRAYHVQGAVLLRGSCVRVLKRTTKDVLVGFSAMFHFSLFQ
jgi:hypothetical protein